MADNRYQVIITVGNKGASGCVEALEANKSPFNIKFDPATVLCDLFDTVDYEKQSDCEQENYTFRQDYFKHPFFEINLPEDMFYSKLQSQLHFSWFYDFIVELKELCEQSRNISLSQFEVFRQYFNTRFTHRIEFQEDNPYYLDYEFCRMNSMDALADQPFIYRGIEENRDFTMKEVLQSHADTPLRHNYSCYSLADIICSVWHYLILHEYKFSRCNHCGRYFATQTLKKLYCDRTSPYPGFGQHNCEQAVRNIKQKLARRKKSAYTYLSNYYISGVDHFLNECAALRDAVDERPTVERLRELETFLSKENVRSEWYKDEYR